jgi:hypothetical protein
VRATPAEHGRIPRRFEIDEGFPENSTGQDRKRVFDLAKQLALNDANTRT